MPSSAVHALTLWTGPPLMVRPMSWGPYPHNLVFVFFTIVLAFWFFLFFSLKVVFISTLWGYGSQDMGRTIRGGPTHKIKACTALLGVHRKTLYSTK